MVPLCIRRRYEAHCQRITANRRNIVYGPTRNLPFAASMVGMLMDAFFLEPAACLSSPPTPINARERRFRGPPTHAEVALGGCLPIVRIANDKHSLTYSIELSDQECAKSRTEQAPRKRTAPSAEVSVWKNTE